MSMIGLFTTGTHAAGAATATDDPAAASGFGAALQGAVEALTGTAAGSESAELATATSLTELGSAPQPASDTPPALGRVVSSETLTGDPVLASTSPSALAPADPSPAPSEGDPDAAVPVAAANPDLLAEPVGAATVASSPTPTTSASTVAPVEAAPAPAVPTDETAVLGRPAATGELLGGQDAGSTTSATTTASPLPDDAEPVAPIPMPAAKNTEAGLAPAPAPQAAAAQPATGSAVPAPASPKLAADGSAAVTAPLTQPLDTHAGNPAAASSSASPASPATPVRGPVEGTAQAPTVGAVPNATPAPSVAPATPVAAPGHAASAPLATQLARPIFSLAAAGNGQHVMTVSVTPDNLGPVTLRAHVGADGVRVELFAPNDIGRDAIRAIIPELRRDLAGAGLGGNLTLSSQNQPSTGSDHSATGQFGAGHGERDGTAVRSSTGGRDDATDVPSAESDSRPNSFGSSTIDVLA